MITAPLVERVRPGALAPDFWALRPARLCCRADEYQADGLPALTVRAPQAVLWLGLAGEDLVVFGPFGDVAAYGALTEAARCVAEETGRARLVASVRNDEIERFDSLQRLGFRLVEARIGVLSQAGEDEGEQARMWGDIAARDELVLARAVYRH